MTSPTPPTAGPTTATDVLRDAFGRVRELVPEAVAGLSAEELLWRPDAEANSAGWLVWHLTRVQDDHLAGVGQVEQLWTGAGWKERFDLPYPAEDIGYGQSSEDVAAFRLERPELLVDYHAAVHDLTMRVLDGLDDDGYARVVDESWDPPVTAAVRLVSVVNDVTQHVGQAAYVRGLVLRRR